MKDVGTVKWFSSSGRKIEAKARQQRNARSARRPASKAPLIVTLTVLVVLLAAALSMGFYINNLKTVYPNVWADGINLSGMTLEEAVDALRRSGYESNADGVAVTVTFPGGAGFSISGNDAGFSRTADEAAGVAYEHGRGGTFFSNGLEYIKAVFNETDLRDLSNAKFNEEYVRDVVNENTKKFNAALIDEFYTMSEESIIVTKGTGVEPADEDEVYKLTETTLFRAMQDRAHLTVMFTPDVSGTDEVDLELLFSIINVDPVDAVYDPETTDISQSSDGVTFDIAAAQARLDSARNGEQVVIRLMRTEPVITTEQLESLLFRDVLSSRVTDIGGTSNRLNNITLASASIDGLVLKPGEVFSYNGTVGERTAARGFKEASAYVGGETVLEIGGGICQVSSSLYDCVLHADLDVVERTNHRYVVTYLPLGNDATVNWGTLDFKFRNSTDYPIRIEVSVVDRKLTVKLIGTKLDDGYIKIGYNLLSTTPFTTIEEEDESVEPGQSVVKTTGYTGQVVETYKYYYDKNDNLIEQKYVNKSTYSARNKIVLIPLSEPLEIDPFDPDDPDASQPPTEPPDETSPPPTDPTDEPPTDEPPTDEPPETTEPPPTDDDPDRQTPDEPPDTPPESQSPPVEDDV